MQSDYTCPLCCEELDISDREFYPCKCGYQVCMWCWHRIRESESGLCPACRTPYGEDPHQFSAIDVEEVLKANKEKEAAAKRERQLRQQQLEELNANHPGTLADAANGASVLATTGNTVGGGAGSAAAGGGNNTLMMIEAPKDRTQLANMRVIRRNLVYAVGLPPHIATEEILRKPEYFGQYGKIAKIVLNRTQAVGDPRRASASAYVTFVHKEDTLACILALDGFYLENRNIRASYGTSKYCSAFIKNVRCNNPECTYLHEMGAAEDTFTKQEIQAGYVTSGRDVLARQQQILSEQLRLGNMGPPPRKKIGGGGPSGTGKAATHPVFPIPEFDEPTKPSPPLVPPPQGVARSQTFVTLNPQNISAKLGRSSSLGTNAAIGLSGNAKSPTLGSMIPPAGIPISQHRKSQSGSTSGGTVIAAVPTAHDSTAPPPPPVSSSTATPPTTTAASVVAGAGRVVKTEPSSDPHTTLTPLTPLKRATKTTAARSASVGANTDSSSSSSLGGMEKLVSLRNGATSKKQSTLLSPSSSSHQLNGAQHSPSTSDVEITSSVASIGGDVIAIPGTQARLVAPSTSSSVGALGGDPVGPPIGSLSGLVDGGGGGGGDRTIPLSSSTLGGEIYTGQLPRGQKSAIGSHGDKWNGSASIGGSALGTSHVLRGAGNAAAAPSPATSLWHNGLSGANLAPGPSSLGGSVIGSSRAPGSDRLGNTANSTSTLASILGINLPTGSGSLHEVSSSSSLWATGSSPAGPSPLSSLNGTALPTQDAFNSRGMIGGSSLIGGVPITSSSPSTSSSHLNGPGAIGSSSKNDIALLQSLLPGVHITSGNESLRFGGPAPGPHSWNSPAPGPSFGPAGLTGDAIGGTSWNGGLAQSTGSIGAIGQNHNQRRGPGIW